MDSILIFLMVITVLLIVLITFFIKNILHNKEKNTENKYSTENILREESKLSREEYANNISLLRKEISELFNQLADRQMIGLKSFQDSSEKGMSILTSMQKDKLTQFEKQQNDLINSTEKKLEQIRITVEEKLEKTLSERLGQSFETVGKQLIEVQQGLGEMRLLAQDVGGLKRVLNNVKMRGGIGEVQLSLLLEQILAPEQYEANVRTKTNSRDIVEFAIKLPGKDKNINNIWLPIDAKFPKDVYETLQNAYDSGDLTLIEQEQKNLDNTIKKMAKDISEKYIDPPYTTDFAIMFLPFEGIYAEVVRKAALLEELQNKFKIIVTGPTTLAAILNSLQMGFRTLAIEKRSSEVWGVLGAVKTEFETFGGLLQKAQKNIQGGLDDIEKLVGTRTKAIQRRLKDVETIEEDKSRKLIDNI